MAKESNKDSEKEKSKSKYASTKLSLEDIFNYFKANWYWFAISVVIFCSLGYFYGKLKPAVYEVDANIRISQDESNGLLSIAGFTDLFGGGNNVDDEVFVVQSHSVISEVVRDDSLFIDYYVKKGFMRTELAYRNGPIKITVPAGIQDTLRKTLIFKIKSKGGQLNSMEIKAGKDKVMNVKNLALPASVKTPYGTFIFSATKSYPADETVKTSILVSGVDAKAEDLAKQVTISVANRNSNVISLSFKSPSISYAKDLINSIIKQYNLRAIADKNAQASQTLDFIDSRLTVISSALADAEDNVADYKSKHDIPDIAAETTYNYTKRGELDKSLIEAGSKLEVIGITRDFLRAPDNAFSLIPTTIDNVGVSQLISSYNELILKRMELANAAKGNNSMLKTMDEQLSAMRRNILTSLDRIYNDQQVVYNNIKNQSEKAASRLGSVPAQERQFRDILRQQKIKEQLYIFLLQRREETAMMMANALPKGIIIDEAYALNEPVSMSAKMLLILCFMFGIAVPAGILYIKLTTRTHFNSRTELERLTQMPILGEVCLTKRTEPLVVYNGGSSSISELFRLIRTNLQFVLGTKDQRVILTTSTRSGEGKTFVAINLAASLALLGKRVLLIGMDIRKPMLESYLSLSRGQGLTEYLSDEEVPLDAIIRRHPLEESSMDIITAGPVPPNPAELLLSDRLDELFDKLRGMYDYIIIDSAPVGMVSDSFTLERLADATVYICRAEYTTHTDINFVNKIYEERRLKKLSLILNGTPVRKGYGYGYGKRTED